MKVIGSLEGQGSQNGRRLSTNSASEHATLNDVLASAAQPDKLVENTPSDNFVSRNDARTVTCKDDNNFFSYAAHILLSLKYGGGLTDQLKTSSSLT